MATSANGRTLLAAIKQDHREIEAYWNEYKKSSGNIDAQTRWSNQLTWEIARHSIGEELVVYPLLEDALGSQGHEMAEEDRRDHQYVKEGLKKLEKQKIGSAGFTATLTDVMNHLAEHIKSEETQDFPRLEQAIGFDKSVYTATSFERTKMFVPTRSHPSAPAKPPFETLAGLLAAPIDKLKDAFSKFPTESQTEDIKSHIPPQN
ncbi:HHE domain-containing protein [Coprinellus micaceus]|uniref:HHE domain-containing protein n=1 Tax=Coprinellus micaceus TaxID=71717 RepID=A0A4Y7TS82_COPMI|nr:HHE domain-containing protein [Coprinellus micaceus]